MKRNSIEKSQYIADRYKTYLRSTFRFKNQKLQKKFEDELEKENLFKGPYVDLNLPFQKGKNINELVNEGVICRSFLNLSNIDFSRPLYTHQEEAIRKIGKGKSTIVTTGTGSGKTECFLYPILNSILSEIENGNHETGIRAVFLYPMNALVNNQFDRIRKILASCPDITYGFFTGDTPENVALNYREKQNEQDENKQIPINELVSREEIRENPPDLLFTNYSMLEYMLIRPGDYRLFIPESLHNWKYVVLDEAHTYRGTLGIEIAMLMRRLTATVDVKPKFILTSATLGEQGQSEQEIVDFAKDLTSVNFDAEDIIFSKRMPLAHKEEYKVEGSDYQQLKDNEREPDFINNICRKYHAPVGANCQESLFELLSRDIHVHLLCKILKNEAKNFYDISKEFTDLEESELVALIDLINLSEKDGNGLYELKYHSFVRPLSGAYITLEKDPMLSLTKTNSIGDLKAFEIGTCRYCNTPFIIGKIQKNKRDHLEYLRQNDEVDIYENYGDYELAGVDYFLAEDLTDKEEIETNENDEYILCARCGCIYSKDNLNADKCHCDDSYKRIIFKAKMRKQDEDEGYNNLFQCPCCKHRSNSGIVRKLDVGKDEGTAIIAQILYEALDEDDKTVQVAPKLSLKVGDHKNQSIPKAPRVKQFLSFSDSRQEASFAAVFMDSSYKRMLRKRLIWKVIEDQSFRDLTVDELASQLTAIIKNNRLFSYDKDLTAQKNAWIAVLVDLMKVDGSYDGEGMGLYYFDLDLSYIMNQFSEQDIEEEFGRYDLTKHDFETIMQVVLGVFKTTPAIDSAKSTLTQEEKREFLEYRRFDNSVIFSESKGRNNVKSFLPIKGSNSQMRYVQKVCGCTDKEAEDILYVIFNELSVKGGLLKEQGIKSTYQIEAGKYVVKNYKTNKFYRCKECGRLTPYNVHNKCPMDRCEGELVEINPDEALQNNFYRNQYKTMKIENIVIKEHTAQLKREEARKYQQEFIDQKINILSCSTTFELGVDIGDLETVFMRNVPPTPANYVQRAGRAGRRKDSAAYILTYCGMGSHDYTYFCAPENMISGVINPPSFNVKNKKIIERHLMACSLGFFFREYPQYYASVNDFVFGEGVNVFKNYMESHPEDLNEYINYHVLPEEEFLEYHDFRWYNEMGEDEKLKFFVDDFKQMDRECEEARKKALQEDDYKQAGYYKDQLNKLHNANMLDSLSNYCVIPKYGFPVDAVELKIYKNGKPKNGYDLNRDLQIAVSEYAPDSEVVVDGKKYTSKYITLPRASSFPKNYLSTCKQCQGTNVYLDSNNPKKCKFCGAPIKVDENQFYIDPVYGFKTGDTKESTRMRPKRTYSGEVSYLGSGIQDEKCLEIGDCICVKSSTNSELLVVNKASFFMCPDCGYSEIAMDDGAALNKRVQHKNYRQYSCPNDQLTRINLGHSFQTDVTRLSIPLLEMGEDTSWPQALSFMYAFLEGISIVLELERSDIDGLLLENVKEESYDILAYDNVPGGAGYVKRLLDKNLLIQSLEAALEVVSKDCCDENTSCYNCLRNYHNQRYHGLLRRKYAKDLLKSLLGEIHQLVNE